MKKFYAISQETVLWLVFSILFSSLYFLKNILLSPSVYLEWPSKQSLSPLLYAKQLLTNDMVSEALLLGPYSRLINLVSDFFSNHFSTVVATYSALSLILCVLTLLLSFYLIWSISCFLIESFLEKEKQKAATFVSLVLLFCHQLYNIPFLSKLLQPARIASWSFPSNMGFGPSGITSLLIILCAILLIRNRDALLNKWQLLSICSLFSVASYFQPSEAMLIIVGFIPDIFNKNFIKSQRFKLMLFLFLIWIAQSIVLFLSNLHQEFYLSGAELFSIYIEQRHPHHYMPSYYIKSALRPFIFNFFLILGASFIVKKSTNSPLAYRCLLLSLVSILFLLLLHIGQYVFVEIYQIKPFIQLGLSRLSSLWGAIYPAIMLSLISALLVKAFSSLRICQNTYYVNRISLAYLSLGGYLLLTSLLISQVIIAYNIALKKLPEDPAFLLSSSINTSKPVLFLIESGTEFENARETGRFAIFSDSYYPFGDAIVKKWAKHRNVALTLKEKLYDQGLPISFQTLPIWPEVIISDKKIDSLLPTTYSFYNSKKVNNIVYYVYFLSL